MDISYDDLYNRALDVTAVIHISVKLFAMFIVLKYTPNDHRYHSYFILNIMFWNFLSNLITTFPHFTPLYPAECYRTDGLSSLLIDNETFGHAMFLTGLASLTHCTVALTSAFPYRYVVFAHPHFAANTKPHRVMLLCCVVHVLITILLLPLLTQWAVSYDNYPEHAELPARTQVFCFYPYGHRKIAAISVFLASVVTLMIVITVFSVLILLKLRSKVHAFHSKTIALQRKLFTSLVIITGISFLIAGFPLFIVVFLSFVPHLPYARFIAMGCFVIFANHGSVYS